MLNLQQLLIQHFVDELKGKYLNQYGLLEPEYGNILSWAGYLALENIGNSDSLYHNMDHTMMVTLAGQEIIRGKHLKDGNVEPSDWLHYILALLFHDIGYVKGVCKRDRIGKYSTGFNDEVVELPPGGTDAALTPYHVDRSILFVYERFDNMKHIDPDKIASFIEMTRFPVPDDPKYRDTRSFGGLTRAADFIGQLGDPNYMRKTPALFYEFEEIGHNKKIGYNNPGDMRKRYAHFFWEVVSPYIQEALSCLWITQEGKQWIANLHSHVFAVEHHDEELSFENKISSYANGK